MKRANTALVITSIAAPNEILRSFAEGCASNEIDFILIGDRSSPYNFQMEGCDYWSIDRQLKMPFSLASVLPERHYGRKNLGYLQAIANSAQVIIETDDDNIPLASFWAPRSLHCEAEELRDQQWVNIYRYFSLERIWPRGFPLEQLNAPINVPDAERMLKCPIQQGLADGDPDVDAIYRLSGTLPIEFEQRTPVALGPRSWCPFNSQNTTWFSEAFPLLYLPSHCSFRMTDTWRSYVAVRICWENDQHVLFHSPTVRQERNEHDLMKDFADELVGYQNNNAICRRLEKLVLKPGAEHVQENMLRCYNEFIKMGLIAEAERPLLEAWFTDLAKLNVIGTSADRISAT